MKQSGLFFTAILSAALFLSACGDYEDASQTSPANQSYTAKVAQNYDNPPLPVDGIGALMQNMKYPKSAKEKELQGRMIYEVTVAKNGDVVAAKFLEGLEDPEMQAAVIEAIHATKWQAGDRDGQPVDASVKIPFVFKLN